MTTTQQILAWVGGAGVALSPLVYLVIKYLSSRVTNATIETKLKQRELLRSAAHDAVMYAQERRLDEKQDGAWAAKVATDYLVEQLGIDEEDAAAAVRTAVAEAPGIGETGKRNGAH